MALFLAGIAAGMVLTQRLRSEGPVVSRIAFKEKAAAGYRVCFQTPRDDSFDVALVDEEGARVRVLASGAELEGDTSPDKDSAHCFDWDGLDDAGTPAPPGNYRLSLVLRGEGRSVVSGEKLQVAETAPEPEPAAGP
ncbi:MAG: FlgD Ig-like domain [Solirubrobacterales bacterium]|nr:FlgD Ig-like domain [Solirubrobacterales bacterium]